ncbi:exonuclease [Bacillus phage Hobo]|uniref:Exonuclease SbcC n=2 Tax=Caeruleovirus BM15 TaxID=1985178 RepID=A0A0S2MUG2_9CAUD|nr:exonuclease [Bacillus phage BM15]ALO79526.1 exonuclease SbcC [Bacillus phage BM15]AXQ66877.1 exonuclease [Bacillus phage Hobo]
MQWDKLIVKNFLAINEATVPLHNQGLVLIDGINESDPKFKSNGAGKSTLIPDALSYALYDITTKGDKADDVINNKVGKNTEVILIGRKGEDTYRIERYRKHTKHKNKVKLFRNDTEITGKTAPVTNKLIEELIGVPYNTFINSILFAQKSDGLGSFAVLPDSRKKEILDSLLNLDIYSLAQKVAKERVASKEREIDEKKREGDKLEWNLQQVDVLEEREKQQYENTRALIKQEQKNLADTIKQLNDYPAKFFPVVDKCREEVERLTKERDEMATVDISSYQNDVNQKQQLVMATKAEINRLTKEKAIIVTNYKKVEMSKTCPVCGSELDNTHREQELNSLKDQLRQVLISLQSLEPLLQQHETEYQAAYEVFSQHKDVQNRAMEEYRNISMQIQKNEQAVQHYETNLKALKDKVKHISSTLEKLMSIPEPQKKDSDREGIKEQITAHKHSLVALEKEKLALEDVVKVYSNEGVKSHVLDLITPVLNEQGNKYLAQLAGSNMELKFSTRTPKKDGGFSEKFDVQLINRAGGDKYKSNSGGERKRADLAISLAIQDLVLGGTNLIVYDEVFDALDEVGVESTIELLQERVKTIGTIFVITHNQHFSNLFEKRITVVKDKNGISTLKEGEGKS